MLSRGLAKSDKDKERAGERASQMNPSCMYIFMILMKINNQDMILTS